MSGAGRGIVSGVLIFAIFFLVIIGPISAYGQVILSGHVRDANGAGVCGASIVVQNTQQTYYNSQGTAVDGSYSLSVPAGTYIVSMGYTIMGIPPYCLGQPTYPDHSITETLTIAGDTVKDYVFPPLYIISGHVMDQNGGPTGQDHFAYYAFPQPLFNAVLRT